MVYRGRWYCDELATRQADERVGVMGENGGRTGDADRESEGYAFSVSVVLLVVSRVREGIVCRCVV
jgi:hypothetical protein